MSFQDKWLKSLTVFILKLFGYKEILNKAKLPSPQPKMLPEDLVIKIEQSLTMCTELGVMEQKELGFYMGNYVCPVCPASKGCPVPEIYKLMESGAEQDIIKQKMEEAAAKLGMALSVELKTTPAFLKIKPDEENN